MVILEFILYLLASEANIGDATKSPTIKAEDRIPSSKLFKLNSPLQIKQSYEVTSKMKIETSLQ